MPPVRTIRPDHRRRAAGPESGALEIRRRDALKFLASGLALSLAGCSRPKDEIVPYVDMPEQMVPGEPEYYATALTLAGYARGVLVKAIDGRPIKVTGNPRHPASLGSTDIFAEAAILSLYDPDRSSVLKGPEPIETWDTFLSALAPRMAALRQRKGEGLRLVTARVSSPTLLAQIAELKTLFPAMRWHAYEPGEGDLAEATPAGPLPDLASADVIVALGADPLGPGPHQIVNARAFASRRRPTGGRPVSRLYVLESDRTLTGANADHRLSLAPRALTAFAEALAARIEGGPPGTPLPDDQERLLDAIVADVGSAGGKALLLAGDALPAATRTKIVTALPSRDDSRAPGAQRSAGPAAPAPVEELFAALDEGSVTDFIAIDCNPVYDFPDDRLRWAVGHLPFSAHAGMDVDETAEACGWHLPLSHPLESWSDATAHDGTVSIVQPLIRPLYDSRTAHELLALLAGNPAPDGHAIVQDAWRKRRGAAGFDAWWHQALVSGVATDTATPAPVMAASGNPAGPTTAGHGAQRGVFAAVIRPDPTIYDGRFVNNAWLQECPKPLHKTTWSNIVTLSPGDAGRLSVSDGDVVRVSSSEGQIEGPVLVDRGQGDGIAGLTLGYGHSRGGAIGTGIGYNARELAPRRLATVIEGVTVEPTGKRDPVPSTQDHFKLEGDKGKLLPRVTQATQFALDTSARPKSGEHFNEPDPQTDGYEWAMVIDSAACIGCNACVVACQSENNIPVVGPDEVANQRIMHWLRIDRYEDEEGPTSIPGFEPVPCMQCEKAPCEPVCPVEASVHDIEGINNQVYNRCVGTRFCESNCPYKVRRFNWYAYNSGQEYKNLGHAPMAAQKNPDVTVRARGVMEKCTYCIQRISRGRREAEKTDQPIPDGGVRTACQEACPSRAIHFGNRADAGSAVNRLRDDPRHFTLLEELGTAPRTTYLARLRNPNPELVKGET